MKRALSLIGVTLLAGAGLTLAVASSLHAIQAPHPAPAVPANPQETPLRELHAAIVKAYNAADAKALSECFTDDAALINSDGEVTRGRVEIAAMYARAFKEAKGLKLESMVESIRFLTPDVARVEGQATLSGSESDATRPSSFVALLVRHDGRWRLAELRDYAAPAEDVSAYDRLKELEWMVGDWVDESDNARIRSSVRWAVNESFLIRTYRVEVDGEPSMDGTSFIGWDPQSGQIKSWVFDSEGGHGEGLWTRVAQNRWIVKSHGVTRDGRSNSATQIQTLVGKDSVKITSRDRIIGGEAAPDIVDVLMVRQPPPAATTGQPAPAPSTPR